MRRSIKNVMMMVLSWLFLGGVSVHADLIYNPMDMVMESFGVVFVVGAAIALLIFATVGLLIYVKKSKKKSQSEERKEEY